jgi:hypothetical protein
MVVDELLQSMLAKEIVSPRHAQYQKIMFGVVKYHVY